MPKQLPKLPQGFDEEKLRNTRAYLRWEKWKVEHPGEPFHYYNNMFIPGAPNVDELLMRRIFTKYKNNSSANARENILKRCQTEKNKRQANKPIKEEPTEDSIVTTRTYNKWINLPDGNTLIYGKKHI
jgi:hypothetical protein